MFKDISIKRKFQAVSDQTTELLRLKVSLDLMVKDTRAEVSARKLNFPAPKL